MNTSTHTRLLELLSTMLIELNALQTRLNQGTDAIDMSALLNNNLKDIEQMMRNAIYVVRANIEEMPPAQLEQVTLAEALSRMVEETAERLHSSSRIAFSGIDEHGKTEGKTLPITIERLFLLLAHEALYQIEQHQDVHRLRLSLSYGQEYAQMILEDDSLNTMDGLAQDKETGAKTRSTTGSSGLPDTKNTSVLAFMLEPEITDAPILADLRQRVEQYAGRLEITQEEGGRGTRFLLQMPYVQPTDTRDDKANLLESMAGSGRSTTSKNGRVETATVEQVRILIVDAQAVTRAGLHSLLESYAGLQVIGEAGDGVQAVSETLELGPQVVLMDAQLPGGQSLEALRQIKQLNLDTHILLLATQDREEYLYETLRAGADGYVLKDIAPDELAQAIRRIARGETLIQAGHLLSRFGKQGRNNRYETLTTRELEVLNLLVRGLRNKEIAARLFVSERTVNFHLANIYQKLNVSGRTEALSKALAQGLITT